MHYEVYPKGVCPTELEFDLEGDRVTNIRFHGGCNGGLKTIASLIDGWTVDQIAEKLEGVTCGPKSTSCSNELVRELKKALAEQVELEITDNTEQIELGHQSEPEVK